MALVKNQDALVEQLNSILDIDLRLCTVITPLVRDPFSAGFTLVRFFYKSHYIVLCTPFSAVNPLLFSADSLSAEKFFGTILRTKRVIAVYVTA